MKSAARIARTFRMDPVIVLNAEPFEWGIRIAAHNVVANEERAAAEKANKPK